MLNTTALIVSYTRLFIILLCLIGSEILGQFNPEKKALHKLAEYNNIIIATGGGTPCFFDNMTWMNAHGTTIFINEPVSILVQRLQNEKAKRPLISNSPNDDLEILLQQRLAERIGVYSQAKHTITGSLASVTDFLKIINGSDEKRLSVL